MCDDDEAPFYALLLATCQACQPSAKPLTADAMNLMFADLRDYPLALVEKSLQAHRRDKDRGQWLPSVAHIEHQIDIRRAVLWLGADEVWPTMPKTESESALLTQEMAQAMAVAQPLLDNDEETAARMAFRAAYTRLTDRAKLEKRAPAYFLSQGTDFGGRISAVADGVRTGLLTSAQALVILPAAAAEIAAVSDTAPVQLTASPEGMRKLGAQLSTLEMKGMPS